MLRHFLRWYQMIRKRSRLNASKTEGSELQTITCQFQSAGTGYPTKRKLRRYCSSATNDIYSRSLWRIALPVRTISRNYLAILAHLTWRIYSREMWPTNSTNTQPSYDNGSTNFAGRARRRKSVSQSTGSLSDATFNKHLSRPRKRLRRHRRGFTIHSGSASQLMMWSLITWQLWCGYHSCTASVTIDGQNASMSCSKRRRESEKYTYSESSDW